MGGSHWGVIHNQTDKEVVYILHCEELTPIESKIVVGAKAEIKSAMSDLETGNFNYI